MPEDEPVPPQPEVTQPPETPPEPVPMLDVHPAHHAASTWRDFFIHIATISFESSHLAPERSHKLAG
jgi:hypothetical protein